MIGTPEVILILVIALLLFGPDKIPELARTLGTSIKEFKKAQLEAQYDIKKLVNCKNCSNLTTTVEQDGIKDVCKEKLVVRQENHTCDKYI